jgi:ribosome biogenesis GTPase
MTTDPKLRAIGWKPFFQQQLGPDLPHHAVVARVSAHFGSQLLMMGAAGEFRIPIQLADAAGETAVGDWLVLDGQDHRVIERLERQTLLTRNPPGRATRPQPIAANIDTLLIVSSCNSDFSLSRIERFLAIALQAGVQPVVVLTKADLCEDCYRLRQQVQRLRPGLLVETLDARDPIQVDVLTTWCLAGQSVAMVGSSGVGKSTLANTLGAGELATAGIRDYDDKGRHTTTARSLHLLPCGGVLVDNPGVREVQLPACAEGVADLFDDVVRLAEKCRFKNCTHEGDPGCAVQAAMARGDLDERRFASYMKLQAEQSHLARSPLERRQQARKFGRMAKQILADKRKRRDETL